MIQFDNPVTTSTENIVTVEPGNYFSLQTIDNDCRIYRKVIVTDNTARWIKVVKDYDGVSILSSVQTDNLPFQIERVFTNEKDYQFISEQEFNQNFEIALAVLNSANE